MDISEYLIEKAKIVTIIVPNEPNENIYFSNFFEITSLDKIDDIYNVSTIEPANESTKKSTKEPTKKQTKEPAKKPTKKQPNYKEKAKSVKDLIESYKIESKFDDNTPIFPIDFDKRKDSDNEIEYWLNYSRMVYYTIYSILAKKIKRSKIDGEEWFEFKAKYIKEIKMNFKKNKGKDLIIHVKEDGKTGEPIKYEKKIMREMLRNFVNSGFLSGIGIQNEIRNYSLSEVQAYYNHPSKLADYLDLLIQEHNNFRKSLLDGEIEKVKTTTEFIEKSLKTTVTELMKSTTKLTQQITKSVIAAITSTAVTIIGYIVDHLETNLKWFYILFTPFLAGSFFVVFIVEICSIRRGVIEQIDLYDKSKVVLEDKIGERWENEELEKQLDVKKKRFKRVFCFVFTVFLLLVAFVIGLMIFVLVTTFRKPSELC
ncbi:MAG: hypothetical protein FK733_14535 [Asgard group archaeon]|nr:hypothetical protein [Asgard group archaeon]